MRIPRAPRAAFKDPLDREVRSENITDYNKELSMRLWRYILGVTLGVAAATAAYGRTPQDSQSPKQDMKDAGHATKDAAKDTGHATKKTAQKTGHATKRTTKKAAHKTARKTRQGAEKVEDKTQPQ